MKQEERMTVRGLYFSVILCILLSSGSYSYDLRCNVPLIPGLVESAENGPFIEFVRTMDEAYPDGRIFIEINSWSRAIYNVVNGDVDFMLPMILNGNVDIDSIPYSFVSEPMGIVCFVLYTNKDHVVTKEKILSHKNPSTYPFIIDVQGPLTKYYLFPSTISYDLSGSFARLSIGRIHAIIAAQEDGDIIAALQKIENIHRELWGCENDRIVVAKSKRGGEIDAILSACIKKMEKSGELRRIRDKIHRPYLDWQPYLKDSKKK